MLLQGIFPAATTPFYPDGKLYLKKLEHNVDRYSKKPIAGLVILGSKGEAVMLSDDEQRTGLKLSIEVASDEKVMIAGTGQESAAQTLALTEYAAHLGYDVALVRTPSYYRPQMKSKPESLLAHYRFVADRSPLPVLLYSVPPFTAYDLPTEMVVELSQPVGVPSASYLGAETGGATGSKFGGRKLNDDAVDLDLGVIFGNTLAKIGAVAVDDGKE